jgi:hypothetical protein
MKLEDYIPSVETCRKLREAGLAQESIYTWVLEQHTQDRSDDTFEQDLSGTGRIAGSGAEIQDNSVEKGCS